MYFSVPGEGAGNSYCIRVAEEVITPLELRTTEASSEDQAAFLRLLSQSGQRPSRFQGKQAIAGTSPEEHYGRWGPGVSGDT